MLSFVKRLEAVCIWRYIKIIIIIIIIDVALLAADEVSLNPRQEISRVNM